MICKTCGNNVPDGTKFCNRCGAPVEQVSPPPYTPGTYGTTSSGNVSGNKVIWAGVMVVLAMLCIMSVICSGATINMRADGVQMTYSVPLMILPFTFGSAMTLGSMPDSATAAFVFFVIYTIFASVSIILYALSIVFGLKKKAAGIISGIIASALIILTNIVMIIVVFAANGQAAASGIGSMLPSFWLWGSIPVAIFNAIFLAVKGKEIIN